MNKIKDWNDPQISDGDFSQTNKTKFQVGDKAVKVKGYKFPCTIVSVFKTVDGNIRVVGEMDEYGLLHIFNEEQLEHPQFYGTSGTSGNFGTSAQIEKDLRIPGVGC